MFLPIRFCIGIEVASNLNLSSFGKVFIMSHVFPIASINCLPSTPATSNVKVAVRTLMTSYRDSVFCSLFPVVVFIFQLSILFVYVKTANSLVVSPTTLSSFALPLPSIRFTQATPILTVFKIFPLPTCFLHPILFSTFWLTIYWIFIFIPIASFSFYPNLIRSSTVRLSLLTFDSVSASVSHASLDFLCVSFTTKV